MQVRRRKLIYAIFKPVRANVVVETVRKSNEIFGGFISGKILDSAIIGVIAYIVLAIMKMPDTMLVAVIIGVTNIIPFFGTFYRGDPILYHYCFTESGTGIIFPDFCYHFTAGRRKILSDRRSSEIPPGFPLSGLYLPFSYLAVCGAFLECCLVCRSWQ